MQPLDWVDNNQILPDLFQRAGSLARWQAHFTQVPPGLDALAHSDDPLAALESGPPLADRDILAFLQKQLPVQLAQAENEGGEESEFPHRKGRAVEFEPGNRAPGAPRSPEGLVSQAESPHSPPGSISSDASPHSPEGLVSTDQAPRSPQPPPSRRTEPPRSPSGLPAGLLRQIAGQGASPQSGPQKTPPGLLGALSGQVPSPGVPAGPGGRAASPGSAPRSRGDRPHELAPLPGIKPSAPVSPPGFFNHLTQSGSPGLLPGAGDASPLSPQVLANALKTTVGPGSVPTERLAQLASPAGLPGGPNLPPASPRANRSRANEAPPRAPTAHARPGLNRPPHSPLPGGTSEPPPQSPAPLAGLDLLRAAVEQASPPPAPEPSPRSPGLALPGREAGLPQPGNAPAGSPVPQSPDGPVPAPVVSNTFNVTVHMAGDLEGNDEELAEKLTRILVDQARRYGIDV